MIPTIGIERMMTKKLVQLRKMLMQLLKKPKTKRLNLLMKLPMMLPNLLLRMLLKMRLVMLLNLPPVRLVEPLFELLILDTVVKRLNLSTQSLHQIPLRHK